MIRQLTRQIRSSLRRRKNVTGKWPVAVESKFGSSRSALIVHGLHKSATMFLYRFFDDVCSQLDVPLYSIHKELPWQHPGSDSLQKAFVLCPVRSFATTDLEFSGMNQRHLFQVRDPRDVLVSEYYSIGWRHTVEGWSEEDLKRRELIRSLSVDEYVLREPEIAKYPLIDRYQPLLDRIDDASTTVVKYETMVTEFGAWTRQVLPLLDIECEANSDFFNFVEQRYQQEFQADGNETGHRRNVTPGDHLNKLSAETIDALNTRFDSVLKSLNY